ncbi:U3 small nucleolar RNA-associated protein NOL7 [Paramormyrops kingsleyae]|uniref:Nucleolar protein 7 n=1 Tax=Paramormyrops kingsleyae TaxID=1676925 RepID=A0A3B3S597_9TELE|nr:nucleolar protein 7 isoform X1 [Paramormyrops kingsleyae]XP_023671309.1 nucleolar protein 7 isoform X1 [Paramormyrops kingsleyae]
MADKRRGDAGVRKRKSESKKMTEHLQLGVDSSDDEAPDEVTFEDSKAVALRSMKEAIDSARRDKELLKEKRRRKQQLFEEQKKRRRLPDEILEEIDSASSKNPKGPKAKDSEEVSKEEEEEGSDSQEEEEQEMTTVTSGKKKKKRIKKRRIKGGYAVMRVQDQPVTSKQQQRAAEFLQSRLYSPQSNRAPVNHFLSLENKRAQNKGAAVVFVSKQWGENQKTKAANFKKRWLHRRGMEAS